MTIQSTSFSPASRWGSSIMSNEVVSRSAWAATLGLSRLRDSGTSASRIFCDLGGVELAVVTGELGERRGVHESLYSRCGEDALLAQGLGELALESSDRSGG